MRRITYWILSTLSALVLLVGFDASRHGATLAGRAGTAFTSGTTGGAGTTSGTTSGTTGGTTGATRTRTKSAAKTAKTQTVTGAVAQTMWGPVQVQLVVSNGTITAVRVLQYPDGNGRDAEINAYALPILIKETTQQQSARIDMVSGATYTSSGYLASLQSALDQAHL